MAKRSGAMEIPVAHEVGPTADARVTIRFARSRELGGHVASDHQCQPRTVRVLPDPAICRAKATGLDGFADCLVECPFQCEHAVSFGYRFFCRHPQRDEIVLRTPVDV